MERVIEVQISENQTIIELSDLLQKYNADVYIVNKTQGGIQEVNPKSLLGLATLRLQNGVSIKVRGEGDDAEEAIHEVCEFLSANA